MELNEAAHVLDPWNGSGTSTQLARDLGYNVTGFDLNPAMVIVAKARLLDYRAHGSLNKLARNIASRAKRRFTGTDASDPLTRWFDPAGACIIRAYEHAIQELLLDTDQYQRLYSSSLAQVSSLAAFFYVALFRTTRDFLGPFFSSNPTWIKDGKRAEDKVSLERLSLEKAFLSHVAEMDALLTEKRAGAELEGGGHCTIEVASSDTMPLADNIVDAVVTSPPYLTRIDYVVATRPELAILGCTRTEDDTLRDGMTGTPTIDGRAIEVSPLWGSTSQDVLSQVEKHRSRASSTYYAKYYKQYFDAVFRSLTDINRTLAPAGKAVFVVQDSYYKEVHVDLPRIFEEMGASVGWSLKQRIEFKVTSNLAAIHPVGREYRDETKAVECALVFSKPGDAR